MAQKLKEIWLDESETRKKKTGHKTSHERKMPVFRVIGAPDDQGVYNVGGRLGAAQGPAAFKEFFGNLSTGPQDEFLQKLSLVMDMDFVLGLSIEKNHELIKEKTLTSLNEGEFPALIGGGHDYGYPHVAAAAEHYGAKNIAVINIDAHLDMRPLHEQKITSGSGYYLSLENKAVFGKNFYEYGIQKHCNSSLLMKYAKKHGVNVFFLQELRKKGVVQQFKKILNQIQKKKQKVILSLDLDAISMAFAPGVSAPQVDGFTTSEVFQMVELAALQKNLVSFGVFELAPSLDINHMTTRLAAQLVHGLILAKAES